MSVLSDELLACGTRDAGTPDAPRADISLDPCAAGDIDLLFVVDNSGSMREEQNNLIAELPRLVETLTSGDRNGDGVRDFTPVRSLHVGFVSTDMGAGNQMNVRTCIPGLGDDGVLRSTSQSGTEPCSAVYPSGTFEFMRGGDSTSFASTLSCVANLGTAGCAFEQQLEAPLKALTPENPEAWTRAGYTPARFYDAESGLPGILPGHGGGVNGGFLRPNSTLALVVLSDEEDCSVSDYSLFGTDSRFSSVPANLRCNTYRNDPSIVYSTSRYVEGFLGLRRDPSQLVFAVIAGIPPETESAAAAGDFASVLSHPNMAPRADASGSMLEPSCSTANGLAFPPIRMVEVASGLAAQGASVSVSSICNASFGPAINAVIDRLSNIPAACE